MRPTPALEAALPFFAAGFQSLADGVAAIEAEHRCTLTLSAAPTFAARWLVQRLVRFTREHPEIEIRFIASATLTDLNHSDVDCAIRLGRGNWKGVDAECLLPQPFFPVCAPDWRDRLKKPADVANVPAITDEGAMVDWADWFAACGLPMPTLHGPRYTDPGLAIEAALSGQGVMLAWDMVAADLLASGRLVRPFREEAKSDLAYWFVTTAARGKTRKVRSFLDWLKREVHAERGVAPG
ncbi:DNA-binding transcriptional LysR family regulator [Kaistia dalseonensis]|uniref:DNA-binding transcriptional LysR family regulator n=1 Tax=Kaistia dalseonensis TaxID=410840 RepID=A0ABU0H1P2_9HYPH|nr:DNA-binding transcriptional LysR family regulator [Kaistia dalseonensis]